MLAQGNALGTSREAQSSEALKGQNIRLASVYVALSGLEIRNATVH